jgi:hypothetical protein
MVIVPKPVHHNHHWLEQELCELEKMMTQTLEPASVALHTEIANLMRYRHYTDYKQVLQLLPALQEKKPFIFLIHKN